MGVIISIGGEIASGIKETQTANTLAYNLTNKTEYGLWNVGKQQPLMGTILVFGVIIAIILAVFYLRGRGKGGF